MSCNMSWVHARGKLVNVYFSNVESWCCICWTWNLPIADFRAFCRSLVVFVDTHDRNIWVFFYVAKDCMYSFCGLFFFVAVHALFCVADICSRSNVAAETSSVRKLWRRLRTSWSLGWRLRVCLFAVSYPLCSSPSVSSVLLFCSLSLSLALSWGDNSGL